MVDLCGENNERIAFDTRQADQGLNQPVITPKINDLTWHDVDELPEGVRDPFGWDDPLRYLV